MKIIITEEQKKKLFIPRKLSDDDSRYADWNNSQPIIDGIKINQYGIDGRKQGYWEEYYDNGQLDTKGNYINDEKDGYWEWYYSNGDPECKGSYKNGKGEGTWRFYDKNDGLKRKSIYKNGEKIKELPINESIKKNNRKQIKEGRVKASDRIKVYEDDKILVVVPLTHMASCKYGAKTPWCVAVPSNDEHFNEYTENGILFYFIIKSPYDYGDIKEYKFAYYKSLNVNMEEYNGWYDMSDYRYDEENEESTELPDIGLLKFLIPKKVMELVNTFIKEQTPVYQKKILDKKKFIFDKLISDPDNHKISEDKDWVIMYRDEPFGDDYKTLDWFPTPNRINELYVIYLNKNNYKTYRQEIPFYIDIRTYKHSKGPIPKVRELTANEEVSNMKSVFLSYINKIAIPFFSNRKKYFNPQEMSYMYLYPNYVSIGDELGYRDGSKIVNIEPITGSYKPYKIDTDRNKDIYYNTDLGVGLKYDKERHNPSNI
jgi:hypothetical protein